MKGAGGKIEDKKEIHSLVLRNTRLYIQDTGAKEKPGEDHGWSLAPNQQCRNKKDRTFGLACLKDAQHSKAN